MSERLAVCEALAAMIRKHGEASEDEVTFVGMAALQLGLDERENGKVQQTLREGGDFSALLSRITSQPMRAFFVRRMLAAALLDQQISEAEQSVIDETASAFALSAQAMAELVAWMKVSIDVERRLNALLEQI